MNVARKSINVCLGTGWLCNGWGQVGGRNYSGPQEIFGSEKYIWWQSWLWHDFMGAYLCQNLLNLKFQCVQLITYQLYLKIALKISVLSTPIYLNTSNYVLKLSSNITSFVIFPDFCSPLLHMEESAFSSSVLSLYLSSYLHCSSYICS